MSKFNNRNGQPPVRPVSPVATVSRTPDTVTFEGGPGYSRDERSELFLLSVSHMGGEKTFYENGEVRDQRLVRLVRSAAVADPVWTAGLLGWLRSEANMRTVPVMAAAEAAHAMVEAGIPGSRAIIASVLQRADEPGELVSYWRTRFSRTMPMPVKKGVNDAVRRVWTEYAMLKYDTGSHPLSFSDLLELTRPAPATPQQDALFRYILYRTAQRRGRDYTEIVPGDDLPMVAAQAAFYAQVRAGDPAPLTDPDRVRAAGLNWEDLHPLNGNLPEDQRQKPGSLWEALIPSMGYMALLRNLRNFDEAGISKASAESVTRRLSDPGQVARSRQFPYRFLSAHRELSSLRWGPSLEEALQLSVGNIPELPGRTLVLVDTSGSMTNTHMSGRSKVIPLHVAGIFGAALALRNQGRVDLFGFADPRPFPHHVPPGASLLLAADSLVRRSGEAGHGTDISGSIAAAYRSHDRVIVISDMQTMGSPQMHYRGAQMTTAVPPHIPVYGFNLVGYAAAAMPTGSSKRHEMGGITDHTFRQIPLLEAGQSATWPWLDGASG